MTITSHDHHRLILFLFLCFIWKLSGGTRWKPRLTNVSADVWPQLIGISGADTHRSLGLESDLSTTANCKCVNAEAGRDCAASVCQRVHE